MCQLYVSESFVKLWKFIMADKGLCQSEWILGLFRLRQKWKRNDVVCSVIHEVNILKFCVCMCVCGGGVSPCCRLGKNYCFLLLLLFGKEVFWEPGEIFPTRNWANGKDWWWQHVHMSFLKMFREWGEKGLVSVDITMNMMRYKWGVYNKCTPLSLLFCLQYSSVIFVHVFGGLTCCRFE